MFGIVIIIDLKHLEIFDLANSFARFKQLLSCLEFHQSVKNSFKHVLTCPDKFRLAILAIKSILSILEKFDNVLQGAEAEFAPPKMAHIVVLIETT